MTGTPESSHLSNDQPTIEDIAFTAHVDGVEQKYVRFLPPAFQRGTPHDVLIALHGHGSDRWQFIRDERDECRAPRDFAVEHAMIYVSPDYRAKTSWMGPKAEADVLQIITDLTENYRVARVFLTGGSMGGTASLAFAALHPELIDGVASMNGTANFLEYENYQEAIQASFGGTKTEIPFEYKKRSAEYWPERLTMPIGVTVSGEDASVPPDSVLRLAKVMTAIGGKILLIYREELGHVTRYADARTILDFMLANARSKDERGEVRQLAPPGTGDCASNS